MICPKICNITFQFSVNHRRISSTREGDSPGAGKLDRGIPDLSMAQQRERIVIGPVSAFHRSIPGQVFH
jgi:hypothetical protein